MTRHDKEPVSEVEIPADGTEHEVTIDLDAGTVRADKGKGNDPETPTGIWDGI